MAQTQRISRNNTAVLNSGLTRSVVLHSTKIVEVSPTHIKLDTGGWNTYTTRARMNQTSNEWGLGYGVFSKAGNLFVSYMGRTVAFNGNTVTLRRA